MESADCLSLPLLDDSSGCRVIPGKNDGWFSGNVEDVVKVG